MKSIFTTKIALLSASILLLFSASAMALPTANQWVKISTNGLGTTNGGEFQLDIGKDGSYDYTSFCVERDENITNGGVYWISSVEDNVYGGGVNVNTPGGYDTISSATQWVMYNYLYGSFTAEGMTTLTRGTDLLANNVQYVIWFLEGELGWNNLTENIRTFYNSYVKDKTNSNYDDYVTVLNLTSWCGGYYKQSQIIAEQAPVPEPTTMLLFGTGIAGLAAVARRRRVNS